MSRTLISNGTEGSFLRGERIAGVAYRPGDPWPFPIVAGYQKIGVAEWVGEAVTDIAGRDRLCRHGKVNGMYQAYAGQISPSVSPRTYLKLPAQVDALAFSGLVLTQVCHNCGVRAPIEVGEGAVVIGDGMVGYRLRRRWPGGANVAGGPPRLPPSLFGPDVMRHTINARQTDWVQAVRDLLPERIAPPWTPSAHRRATTLQPCRRSSATWFPPVSWASTTCCRCNSCAMANSLDFVSGWTRSLLTTRELIAGYLQTLPLITHRFPQRSRRCLGADRTKRELLGDPTGNCNLLGGESAFPNYLI